MNQDQPINDDDRAGERLELAIATLDGGSVRAAVEHHRDDM